MNPSILPEETLLDRLKRIKAEAESARLDRTGEESTLLSEDFGHLASIALKMARTRLRHEGDEEGIAYLNQHTIVPDDVIPDAHKNEVSLGSFVRANFDRDDWPKFISVDD